MNCARIAALCSVTLISSSLMFAQNGSSGGGRPQTQPGQQPNGTLAGGEAGGIAGAAGGNDATGQGARDKEFLHKAAEGGMAEIKLGQLALQKSNSDDVKQFAQKMIDDHTTLNNNMKPFADSMGVRTPTKLAKKDQAEYDKLNGLSGDDFDKEYLAYMVKDHHQDVKEFRTESTTASDQSLKAAVSTGLQVIQQHTQMAEQLAKSKGVTTGGRG